MVVQIPLNSDRYRAYDNTGSKYCPFCVNFDAEPGACQRFLRRFEELPSGHVRVTMCTGYEQIREAGNA